MRRRLSASSALLVRASRHALAWLVGTLTAYALASVAHTQTVLAGLSALGVRITLAERAATTLGDLVGLWRYALVIGIGLALGLLASRALPRRLVPPSIGVRSALAGALAMAVMLGSMKLAFAFTPIASARGPIGFLLQCLAGGAGGLAYARCLRRLERRRHAAGERR